MKWLAAAIVIAALIVGGALVYASRKDTQERGLTGTITRHFDPSPSELGSPGVPDPSWCHDLQDLPVTVLNRRGGELLGQGSLDGVEMLEPSAGSRTCEATFALKVQEAPLYHFRFGDVFEGPTYSHDEMMQKGFGVDLTVRVSSAPYLRVNDDVENSTGKVLCDPGGCESTSYTPDPDHATLCPSGTAFASEGICTTGD